jgi:hypothetical protein
MLDVRLSLPDDIWDLSEEERQERGWLSDDLCVLDESRFFVRGLLEIPIPELENRFAYGAWAEVDADVWQEVLELWRDEGGRLHPPFPGELANELAPYRGTRGLRVAIQLGPLEVVPSLRLEDDDHPLVRDQRRGITAERSDELAATVLHR